MRRTHGREWAGRAALLLASCVVAVLAAELLLRALGYSRPPLLVAHGVRGFGLRPDVRVLWTSEGRAVVETNSTGFRDVQHARSKPPGVFRLAVLGDSFAEALQVPLDSTFWKRLERGLGACMPAGRRVEALNFGVSGYATAQQLITYRTEARRYAPDLVLLAVTPTNDIRENSRALMALDAQRDANDPSRRRPYFVLEADTLRQEVAVDERDDARARLYDLATGLAAQSRVVQLVWEGRRRLRSARHVVGDAGAEQGLDIEVYHEPRTPAWRDAWRLTEALIAELARDAERDGARLVVATLSQGIQVHPDAAVSDSFMRRHQITDLFHPDRRVQRMAEALGLPTVVLAPELRAYALRSHEHLHGFPNTKPGAGHWNAAGHRVAAGVLTDRLCALLRETD